MKYTATDIARMLTAFEVIDSLKEPEYETVYIKAKSIIDLLDTILSSDECCDKPLKFKTGGTLSKIILYVRFRNEEDKEGYWKSFFRYENVYKLNWDGIEIPFDERPTFNSKPKFLNRWYDIIKEKDSLIEQAIAIRQEINAEKISRINAVK